jgi:rubredoxin
MRFRDPRPIMNPPCEVCGFLFAEEATEEDSDEPESVEEFWAWLRLIWIWGCS